MFHYQKYYCDISCGMVDNLYCSDCITQTSRNNVAYRTQHRIDNINCKIRVGAPPVVWLWRR